MIWIIEGADMTGKTTLAKQLQNKFDLQYEHIHTKPYYYYVDSILDRDNYVYDRHFISEMLYPKVFGREPKLNWMQFDEMVQMIKALQDKIKLVILTADDVEFTQRIMEREDEPKEVIRTLFDIDKEYKAIATLFDIKVINPTDFTVDQIVEMMDEWTSE